MAENITIVKELIVGFLVTKVSAKGGNSRVYTTPITGYGGLSEELTDATESIAVESGEPVGEEIVGILPSNSKSYRVTAYLEDDGEDILLGFEYEGCPAMNWNEIASDKIKRGY